MQRRRFWIGMLVVVNAIAPCAVQAQSAPAGAESDSKYCAALAYQFDRYSSYNEGMSAEGRIERMAGESRCRQGDYAEGLSLLKVAIEKLGFAPLARAKDEAH